MAFAMPIVGGNAYYGGELRGVTQVLRRFADLERATSAGVERGIIKACLFILRESKKIVPVDTGALRASGDTVVIRRGFWSQGYVVYFMRYAIYVHEDLTMSHKKGKMAKFVEIPLKQFAAIVVDIIRTEAIRKVSV